jgi:hypothetical protein
MKTLLSTNGTLAATRAVKEDNKSNSIYSTTDYDKFTTVRGNRIIKPLHLKKLKNAITNNNLLSASPIIVNERMEVVDGQHRLQVAKDLKLPVYYMIVPGLKLKDVQTINANSHQWSADAYALSYVELGNPNYIKYVQFRDKYKFFHAEACAILSHGSEKKPNQEFKDGLFVIKDYAMCEQIAQNILDFEPHYTGFRRRSFVRAMIKISRMPFYKHDVMMQKVRYQSTRLVDCVALNDYLLLLEQIYNYKNKDRARFL